MTTVQFLPLAYIRYVYTFLYLTYDHCLTSLVKQADTDNVDRQYRNLSTVNMRESRVSSYVVYFYVKILAVSVFFMDHLKESHGKNNLFSKNKTLFRFQINRFMHPKIDGF